MRNPLSSILTPSEQKALLFLLVCFFAGCLLNKLGFPAVSPLGANKEHTDLQSFEDSLQTDVVPIIDIRTASLEELILLPGIGEKRAQDIIEHRSHSPFQNVNEIMLIKGIGLKTYEKMRPMLLVFGNDEPIDKSSTSSKTTTEAGSSKTSTKKADLTGKVNLNTATLEQLCTLVGIGPAKAQAIIDYRTEHGAFTAIEDITKVKGIGPATFAKNKDRLEI